MRPTFPSTPAGTLERTSTLARLFRQFDAAADRCLAWIAARPAAPPLLLLALGLLAWVPGVLLLPPVDRTEIVYASASRTMLETANVIDPRYEGTPLKGKPVGAFWLQMFVAATLGPQAHNAITAYRLPSLVGAVLAVLATYGLFAPLLGRRYAFLTAALFAATPILAVEANLAVADGPALAMGITAQLALLRLYCARTEKEAPFSLAFLFWLAQGLGVLINALAVPLLSLATLLALFCFDRRPGWLARLRPLSLAPIAIALGGTWIAARSLADGGFPFHGLSTDEILAALGGSQADKWKAAPGSFTLAFLLGFLPGALLLRPALLRLWYTRKEALSRFLLAWLAGYLAYLEILSGKPALYSVPPLFPAAAAAVTLTLQALPRQNGALLLPQDSFSLPPLAPAAFVLTVTALLLWLAGASPTPLVLAGALLSAALFAFSAEAGRLRLAAAWLALSVTGFAVFVAFVLGVLFPHLEKIWPARQLARAVAPFQACTKAPPAVLGFREPSVRFVLGPGTALAAPEDLAAFARASEPRLAAVEERWLPDVAQAFAVRGETLPPPLGCVVAFNAMRGCPLTFSIHILGKDASSEPACRAPLETACPPLRATAAQSPLAGERCR